MPESAACRYHRLTSYSLDRHWLEPVEDAEVLQDFLPLDEDCCPVPVKTYPAELPRVLLPARLRADGSCAADVLSGRDATRPGTASLDLAGLSWLLYWSAGVLRERRARTGQRTWRRAAGSAGNRQPIEVYVQASGVPGLPDGVWHYGPAAHELVRVGPAAADGVAIILTGTPWRTAWRYAERGYRHLWWDAGSLVAHLDLLARAAGLRARLSLTFPDADIASAVGADERLELPLAVMEIGGQRAWRRPLAAAVPGDLGTDGPDFPLVRRTHEASRLGAWAAADAGQGSDGQGSDGQGSDAASAGPAGLLTGVPSSALDELISRRATTRSFAGKAVPSTAMTWPLAVATRALDWDGDGIRPVFRVFAHRVEGLDPGCYEVGGGQVEQVRAADMVADAVTSCLNQKPAGDCAYLALLCASLDTSLRRHGQRGYRYLQLFAGVVAGRLQLAAAAAGLRSTPLTVCDEAAASFTPPGMIPLIAVAIGAPSR